MKVNDITHLIIGCAIEVHTVLGPGLRELVYTKCLAAELVAAGLDVEIEKRLPVQYKDVKINMGFRIDLLVEDLVVVEVKAVETLHEVHFSQLITYMKFSDKKTGLLINFNVHRLKDGIRRAVF
jgi:GxxExxY protein